MENDRKRRRLYARKMKKILEVSPDFYTNHIGFLDGVSFVHKYNAENVARQPRARVWRRKSERLDFTAKGSKDLPEGRRLHLMVAVRFGNGVILRVAYEKMDGEFIELNTTCIHARSYFISLLNIYINNYVYIYI